jgi:hypothetical protein
VSELSTLVGTKLPDLGALKSDWTLTIDESGRMAFEDLVVTIQDGHRSVIEAKGVIANYDPAAKVQYAGINLDLNVRAASIADFAAITGPQDYDIGPVEAHAKLIGSSEELVLENIDAKFGQGSPVEFSVAGKIDAVRLGGSPRFVAHRLRVTIAATDTSALSPIAGRQVPSFGPVKGSAMVSIGKDGVRVFDIAARAQSASGDVIELAGILRDPTLNGGADLKFSIDLALNPFIDEASDGLELGRLEGQFRLTGADQNLLIQDADLRWHLAKEIRIAGQGHLGEDAGNFGGRLDFAAETDDMSAIADGFGIEGLQPAPAKLAATIEFQNGVFAVNGNGHIGDDATNFEFRIIDEGDRPHISGAVEFAALRSRPPGDEDAGATGSSLEYMQAGAVFSKQPLADALSTPFDFDLNLKVGKIEMSNYTIENVTARVQMLDGRLAIEPMTFSYAGGESKLNLLFDAKQTPPRFSIDVRSMDLSSSLLLGVFGQQDVLNGSLTIDLKLEGHGANARDIVHTLSGRVGVALKNGELVGHDLNLLSPNVANWLISLPQAARTTLNCVLAQFVVRDGLAESEAILIVTPQLNIVGKGKIDLRAETLDLMLSPQRSMSVLPGFSKPVRIHGPILDPAVDVNVLGIAGKAAVNTGSMALLPLFALPFMATGELTGLFRNADKDDPCLAGALAGQ